MFCCSRHGESMFNTQGLIGGNPPLSPWGEEYADMLADFIDASDELATDEVIRTTGQNTYLRRSRRDYLLVLECHW